MPSMDSMTIPPPVSPEEFEAITLTCLKIKWSSPTFSRYGRRGQAQQGVDLYGPDDLGRHVGVQCKHTPSLKMQMILEEARLAEAFVPSLHVFYLATSAPTDAKLQRDVRLVSEKRVREEKFPIGVFFWEDLITELSKNRTEFRKHYPDIRLIDDSSAVRGARLLALVEAGSYGTQLVNYMDLIFGEFGQLANEVPETYRAILDTVSSSATVLFDDTAASQFSSSTEQLWAIVEALCYGQPAANETWHEAQRIARLLSAKIEALEPQLQGIELAAFSAAGMLSRWEFRHDRARKLAAEDFEDLLAAISALSPDASIPEEVSTLIGRYLEEGGEVAASNTPGRIYSVLRRMARSQEIRAAR